MGSNFKTTGSAPAPDFARATGMPKQGQVARTVPAGRAPSTGQTKAPGDQGGRSEADKKA